MTQNGQPIKLVCLHVVHVTVAHRSHKLPWFAWPKARSHRPTHHVFVHYQSSSRLTIGKNAEGLDYVYEKLADVSQAMLH